MGSAGDLRLEFRVLGRFEVAARGRVVEIGSAKQRALLALLVVHLNRPVSSDLLIEELWRGDPPPSAQSTLQSLIYRARRALAAAGADEAGVALRGRGSAYVLEADMLQVDASRFERLAGRARELLVAGAAERAARAFGDALSLWRGQALADLDDVAFARVEAARLEEGRLSALEGLAEAELARNRPEAAVAVLEPHVGAHPLREGACGQLMVALYRLGRQAEALRAYQRLRRVLGEELGLEPNPALRELEAQILLQSPHVEGPGPAVDGQVAMLPTGTGGPSPAGRVPLIGRVAQLGELVAILEPAMAGAGALVTVCGEAGIGKTRLIDELASEALRRRGLVFVGHCSEAEGASSFSPFVQIFEAALAQAPSPETFRAAMGDAAPEIARLVPRLRRLFPDIGRPLELPPDQERRYLFNSMVDTLARTGRAIPTVLIVEDLHWADEATLLMLEHLAAHVSHLPVLLVGTYRDAELEERPFLARTLEDLVRRRLVRQVRLGRLEASEVGLMLGALGGQEAPGPVIDVVFSETEGNPFLVEETFKYLADEGRLFDAEGRFRVDVKLREREVPENVRLVVGRRLDRLSDQTRATLAAAAVIGRYFGYELLEAAAGLAPDTVLDAVDEAARAHLIVAVSEDATGERFGFVHELVRQTVLARVSGPRRHRLHLAVADAMERTFGRELHDHASDLAYHLVEAEGAAAPARTFRILVLAGRRALAAAGFEDAVRHFEQALALDVADEAGRAAVLVDLARAQRSVGRWDESVTSMRAAVDAYEALGDNDAVAHISADASWALAWLARFADAHEFAERGFSAVAGRETSDRGYLLATLGMNKSYVGAYDAGREMLDEAAGLARRLGDSRLAAHVDEHRMHVAWGHVLHREAIEAGRRAADQHLATGNLWDRAMTLGFVLFSLAQLCRFDDVDALRAELEPLAQRLGCYPALLFCHRARLIADLCRKPDLDVVEADAARDFSINEAIGGAWNGQSHTWRALVHFWRGDWGRAEADFEEGMRLDPDGLFNGWGWGWVFLHKAYTGDRDTAMTMLADRRADLPCPGGGPGHWGRWMMLAGVIEGLVIIGEREEATTYHGVVAEALARGVVTVNYHDARLLERVAGIAAAAGRRWDTAEAHFTTALRLSDELPHRIEGLETRRFYGQMLLDRKATGDRDLAARLLGEAAAGYRRLGMRKHAELAEV